MWGLALATTGHNDGPAIILALVAAIILLVFYALSKPHRRQFRPHSRPFLRLLKFDEQRRPDIADVGQQLHAVMAGSFEKRRVLGSSEYRIFAIVESEFASQRLGYRVFAQTSLGEILKSNSEDAFRSINSKRVDILVVDRKGWPILAVEYQGKGHYQGTAAGRDAVKKEALRKAGVQYMEFSASDTDDQIRSRLRDYFVPRATGSR